MTISPNYGLFIALTNDKMRGFAINKIAKERHLPIERGKMLEQIAQKPENVGQVVMVPLHDDANPYYVGHPDKDGTRLRLKVWADPRDNVNASKMVLIQEKEYRVEGEKVIVPDRIMVGPKAPVYAMMKMTCCSESHCGEKPFGAVIAIPKKDGGLAGAFKDPISGVLENRPQILSDGIRLLRPQDLPMALDLATHVWAHAKKRDLPAHDCHSAQHVHSVDLGGGNVMRANPS